MNRRNILFLAALAAFAVLAAAGLGAAPAAERETGLVLYAYDSFVSEWGPAAKVIPRFEALTGAKVTVISAGDAGQTLSRAILEKADPRADLILGIDNNLLARALEEKLLEPYRSPNLELVPAALQFDPTHSVTPFDHGWFAVVYDSQAVKEPPASLEDLASPRFKSRLILEDPRTSSPGLGFLLWTIAVYRDRWPDYWRRLAPSVLTVADGWDAAYGMFTAGEAPLVLSYTTSPAYHLEYEQTERYRAAVFQEGHYRQIEGVGILKGAKHPALARRFIDFVLTEEFQQEIPLTNWMYPVNPKTRLPESFRLAPKPAVSLALPAAEIKANQERWLREWARLLAR
jgi:thiamine transport system substrate-binding protein